MSSGIEATTGLLVEPLAAQTQDGVLRLSARIGFPDGRNEVLWFEVAADTPVTALADPFVLAVLFEAMAAGVPLHVRGAVSGGLLCRLDDFMAAWARLCPGLYRPVPILADQVVADPPSASGSLSTFSGGVDSCFTAYRHSVGDPRYPRIDSALMIHGFDIPLDDPAFPSALASSQRMLEDLGMGLVWMRANVRDVNLQNWTHTHGTMLAACVHVLTPTFGRVYVPSSWAHTEGVRAAGSNPLTDPMLGSEALQVIHDGAAYSRIEKIRAISEWSAGMQGLRVCWSGSKLDENCCRCEKCVRTMINFRMDGLPQPAAFPLPLDPKAIGSLTLGREGLRIWTVLRESVRASKTVEPDVRAAIDSLVTRMTWRHARKCVSRYVRGKSN